MSAERVEMRKKTFVVFGLLVVLLAVLIPWLVFRSDGDAGTGAQEVPARASRTARLSSRSTAAPATRSTRPAPTATSAPTSTNCSPKTGRRKKAPIATAGNPRPKVAIEEGVDSTAPGRMPPGILTGEQAEEVAEFVAHAAGEG